MPATIKVNANLSFLQADYEFAVAPSVARYDGEMGDIGLRLTFRQPPSPHRLLTRHRRYHARRLSRS
jgi:hypothetical protein